MTKKWTTGVGILLLPFILGLLVLVALFPRETIIVVVSGLAGTAATAWIGGLALLVTKPFEGNPDNWADGWDPGYDGPFATVQILLVFVAIFAFPVAAAFTGMGLAEIIS